MKNPVVAHDEKALRDSLISLVPELRGRARRLCGSPTVAEDIVQDTVERALRFEGQYERGSNLRAWVHQILFSVFISRCRRARRERDAMRWLGSDPCAWTVPQRIGSPETSAALSPRAQAELDALPEPFRVVVKLVDLDELSYREAAESLGVPLGTVMSRLHRARKLLAEQLRDAA